MARLHVLKPEQQAQWMNVLTQSFQYDVYHLPGYHALAEERGEGQAHLFLYTEGSYFVAIPLLLRPIEAVPGLARIGKGWWDATSVYGYAGPIASHSDSDLPASVLRDFQTALCETLKEWRIVSVFSRLHPLILQCGLLADLGDCIPMGQTVFIDLSLPADKQRQEYRSNHKRDINRARREGITCVHDDDWKYLDTFIELYHETMGRTDATSYYFFDRAYFTHLRNALGNRLNLFVALKEGAVLSGALFTVCNSIIQYHLGGTYSRYLNLAPSKLIFDTVRVWGKELGADIFHLGGGVGSRQDGLFRFKAGFSSLRGQFSVWRMIVNQDVYTQLSEQKRMWSRAEGLEAVDNDYFPTYRRPTR